MAKPVYRWNGAYGEPGDPSPNGRTTKTNGNKGVQRARKVTKRTQAEARNKLTAPEKRRASARAASFPRHSDRIREGK